MTIDIRAIQTKELDHEPFPNVQQGFRVVIAEEALDRCVERGNADLTREIGGVLVGTILKDESGPYLRVDDTVDALHADEKGAELTFTHETWDYINGEMDTKHAGKNIVGWYHTHPGFGIFLSDRDEFIHKSFFDLPFQVALVYDPKSREQGVFAWEKGTLARMNRYWIGRREHTWAPPEVAVLNSASTPDLETNSDTDSPMSHSSIGVDWPSMAMLGLILLMIGGFGGWWFGSMASAQHQAQLQTRLVEAELQGAKQAIKVLDQRVLSAVRAGFDEDLTRDALREIVSLLHSAKRAAATNPAPAMSGGPTNIVPTVNSPIVDTSPNAVKKIDDALAAITTLGRERKGVSSALAVLSATAADAHAKQFETKQLELQRMALAVLYADLSKVAEKDGDKARAARYLNTAKRIDPKNGIRYRGKNGKRPGPAGPGKTRPAPTRPGMKR